MRELDSVIDSRELSEWMAYERVTGTLGPERLDLLAAIIAASSVNIHLEKSKRVKPEAFMPKWDTRKAQTPEQMRNVMLALNAMFGGTIERET